MAYFDLKQEIRNDIERYRRLVEMYRSGSTTGEMDSQGRLTDRTAEQIGYLKTVISNLENLLQADDPK
jgi:hypothetical protein